MDPTFGEDIGFYIKKIHDAVAVVANAALRPYGVTQSQADVLGFLIHETDGSATLRDVERRFRLSHPTVIGLVRRLEEKELVRTAPDSDDRRCRRVYPTERAQLLEEALFEALGDVRADMARGLSPEDERQMLVWLRRMYGNLARH